MLIAHPFINIFQIYSAREQVHRWYIQQVGLFFCSAVQILLEQVGDSCSYYYFCDLDARIMVDHFVHESQSDLY